MQEYVFSLCREQKLDATSVLIGDIASEGEVDGLKMYYNRKNKADAAVTNGDLASGDENATVPDCGSTDK